MKSWQNMYKIGLHPLCESGRGEPPLLSCALRKGRCKQTFWPIASHPHPQSAQLQIIEITYAWPQPPGLVRIKSMQGAWVYRISCDRTQTWLRQRVTQGTHLPGPFPQIRLCCIKALCKCGSTPGKRQDWSNFERVPFSC